MSKSIISNSTLHDISFPSPDLYSCGSTACSWYARSEQLHLKSRLWSKLYTFTLSILKHKHKFLMKFPMCCFMKHKKGTRKLIFLRCCWNLHRHAWTDSHTVAQWLHMLLQLQRCSFTVPCQALYYVLKKQCNSLVCCHVLYEINIKRCWRNKQTYSLAHYVS